MEARNVICRNKIGAPLLLPFNNVIFLRPFNQLFSTFFDSDLSKGKWYAMVSNVRLGKCGRYIPWLRSPQWRNSIWILFLSPLQKSFAEKLRLWKDKNAALTQTSCDDLLKKLKWELLYPDYEVCGSSWCQGGCILKIHSCKLTRRWRWRSISWVHCFCPPPVHCEWVSDFGWDTSVFLLFLHWGVFNERIRYFSLQPNRFSKCRGRASIFWP